MYIYIYYMIQGMQVVLGFDRLMEINERKQRRKKKNGQFIEFIREVMLYSKIRKEKYNLIF